MKEAVVGLKQRIQAAMTVGAVEALLMEGKGYLNASDGTIRRWNKVAKIRIENIEKEKSKKD